MKLSSKTIINNIVIHHRNKYLHFLMIFSIIKREMLKTHASCIDLELRYFEKIKPSHLQKYIRQLLFVVYMNYDI